VDNKRWALATVIDAHGMRRLRDLEPEHVEAVLVKMAKDGKSRSSILRVRATLAQALDVALRRGKVVRNAARLAEMPRTRRPVAKRALTEDQAASLISAAAGTDVEAFLVVGLGLGLRPGELLGLQWDNVNLKTRTLVVDGSLKREHNRLRLGDVKRGIRASRRRLSLPAPVVETLKAHKAAQAARQLELGPEIWSNADGLVFTTEVGTPIDPSNMNRRLAKVTEAAGLGRWSMTELARHSAASLLSDAGVPLEVIADALGHSSTRMLERHYRHPVRPTIDGHVAAMEQVLGGAR
jgi:integrase